MCVSVYIIVCICVVYWCMCAYCVYIVYVGMCGRRKAYALQCTLVDLQPPQMFMTPVTVRATNKEALCVLFVCHSVFVYPIKDPLVTHSQPLPLSTLPGGLLGFY